MRFAKTLTAFAGVLGIGYGGICASMFFRQASFVYFPSRDVWTDPRSVGLPYEEIRLRTSDGLALGAWWVPSEKARGALVFSHGNAGNVADRLDQIRLFHDLGLSVLIYDYRGYGRSEGSPLEAGTYRDMEAAEEHVIRDRSVPRNRLVLYGESLGGAVAVEAASRNAPAALILESTFTSIADMAARHYPWLPARWLLTIRYDSLAKIRSVRCPLLILHSPEDEIVPFAMGRLLFAGAPGPKRFVDLRGGHNDGGILVSGNAQATLRSFLDETLPEDK